MPSWLELLLAALLPFLLTRLFQGFGFAARTARSIKEDSALLEATTHDSPERKALEREVAEKFDRLMIYREVRRMKRGENFFVGLTVTILVIAIILGVSSVVSGEGWPTLNAVDYLLGVAALLTLLNVSMPLITGRSEFYESIREERDALVASAEAKAKRKALRARVRGRFQSMDKADRPSSTRRARRVSRLRRTVGRPWQAIRWTYTYLGARDRENAAERAKQQPKGP